jgi:hypothetical protein
MLRVQHILVPVEIDKNAAPVVQWAVLLAQALHSRLSLLHVNEAFESLKQRPAFVGLPRIPRQPRSGGATTSRQPGWS